ncbi:MAG: ankyrin repeat domain-containing protein, partial [Treponema sp.]|nr:ankyrin repeat domain-containing protein [Treponema sp.]
LKAEKNSINLFKNEVEKKLANAVIKEDVKRIQKIIGKNQSIVRDSYSKEYYSVLHLASYYGKVKSVEALLELGFNPDVKNIHGETPLFKASGVGLIFYALDESRDNLEQVIKLLIKYGADVNCQIEESNNVTVAGTTPLMECLETLYQPRQLNKIKILCDEGNADINFKAENGETAASIALEYCYRDLIDWYSVDLDYLKDRSLTSAYYLIVQKHADISGSYYSRLHFSDEPFEVSPVYMLRLLVYPLDSEMHKIKMEIVKEFKRQGIDYFSEPIPEQSLKLVKKLYPDNWEEYLRQY